MKDDCIVSQYKGHSYIIYENDGRVTYFWCGAKFLRFYELVKAIEDHINLEIKE